jgi:hypothetical protein
MARVSMQYDVLNFTTLNATLGRFEASEGAQAREHFEHLVPGQNLVILDRGYLSRSLFYEFNQIGVDFCIRLRGDWWLEVRKME